MPEISLAVHTMLDLATLIVLILLPMAVFSWIALYLYEAIQVAIRNIKR